jgi:hypothetical protein
MEAHVEKELSLYNISSQFLELEQKLIDQGGEVTEQDEIILKEINELLLNKVDSCVGFVQKQENFIDAIDSRINELQELKNKVKKGLEKFEDYAINCMEAMNKKELKGEFWKIVLPKRRESVEIFDIDQLPIDVIRVETIIKHSPDKKLIKEKIKAGEEVAGAKIVLGKQTISFKGGSF